MRHCLDLASRDLVLLRQVLLPGCLAAGDRGDRHGQTKGIAVLDRSEFSRARNASQPHPPGPGYLCEANSKTVADRTRTRRTGPSPVIPNHFSASGLRVVPERLAGKRLALRCVAMRVLAASPCRLGCVLPDFEPCQKNGGKWRFFRRPRAPFFGNRAKVSKHKRLA